MSNQPKHTPGPWLLENSTVHGPGNETICTFRYPVYPLNTGPDEHSANARLIAAAPELLKTLKYAAASLEYAAAILEAPKASHIREVLAASYAAILKATGGAE